MIVIKWFWCCSKIILIQFQENSNSMFDIFFSIYSKRVFLISQNKDWISTLTISKPMLQSITLLPTTLISSFYSGGDQNSRWELIRLISKVILTILGCLAFSYRKLIAYVPNLDNYLYIIPTFFRLLIN